MTGVDAVVVTGIGTIGAAGPGAPSLLDALRRGHIEPTEVDRSEGLHREGSARTAALIGSISTADWIPPLVARRMSMPSRYAVVAACMALADAGIDVPKDADASMGVTVATAFGPSSSSQKLIDQILREGPTSVSPTLFTECVANAPAGNIAIRCGAAGPNYTLANREAGPLLALGRGAREVAKKRADVMLAGCVEEITPLLHAVLDRFGALARPDAAGDERARPFDRRRDGFVAAEGGTVVVLERASSAERRDVPPRVRVRAAGRAFDPTATPAGWGRGDETLGRALSGMLRRAGLAPEEIDAVVSGASGSRAGDRLEARTLKRVWGDRIPPIVAPKSVTGEYGGGFLAAAVLAASGESIGGTPGFDEPDPDLGIVPHPAGPFPDARRVLVSSLAAGGAAAWIVLERP